MSTNPKAPGFTILAGIGLSVLILLAWVGQLATLSDLSGSDPAGNALAQAFGALEIIVLWGLLAVLALLAATKGAMPRAAALAITIQIPASGFAAMTAAELLRPSIARRRRIWIIWGWWWIDRRCLQAVQLLLVQLSGNVAA